jgi:hypothetical protein
MGGFQNRVALPDRNHPIGIRSDEKGQSRAKLAHSIRLHHHRLAQVGQHLAQGGSRRSIGQIGPE